MRRGEEPCPTCRATGVIEQEYYRGHGRVGYHEYRCGTCDGSGYLDVPSEREERAHMEGVD